jgi:hypothetical protein
MTFIISEFSASSGMYRWIFSLLCLLMVLTASSDMLAGPVLSIPPLCRCKFLDHDMLAS